ncbi:MAG TPA: DUF1631 domain-containing protein [Spongiibacteraceae bacterium]
MTDPRSKVVPIKSGSSGSGTGKGPNRDGGMVDALAVPLGRLQERCRPMLQQYVQAVFDQADDALFELADRATNNAEQNMFFESMREVRIKRRGIEQAVARDLSENFRSLALGVATEDGIGNDMMDDAAASLSLVDHDELEEMVAVDGMIAKAEKEFAEPLALLTARIDALLPFSVTVKTNPFGPARLCQSFLQATQALDLDIKAKLVLFKLFDRHVVKALDKLYEAGNGLLVDEGVLPRLKRAGASASKSPLSSSGLREDPDAEKVFNSLQQLLGQSRPGMDYVPLDQLSGLVAPGLAPALPRDALMQLLADIQQQQIAWLTRQQAAVMRGVAPQQLDVLQALNRALQQRMPNQAVSIGQVDDDAINLVSMLFQFVLEDRNLAAPIKGLIARLQIPLLKVAMLDKSFFSKGGHPARKLLNEVANASLGWAPANPSLAVERDPFYAKVEALIGRIVDEFADDVAVFQTALEDFIAFVEMDRRRASLIEQRTVDAEDGRAKSELARATVQELLNQKVAGKRLPGVVVKLLQDGWSNVLFLICLKEGLQSESWQRAVQTVDDLLESVSVVESLADRARLLRTLPTLLKNLRSGLNKIGFNPFDLNQLFSDLEQIHLQRLKKEETADLVALDKIEEVEPPLLQEVAAITALRPAPAQTLDEVLASRRQRAEVAEPNDNIEDLDRELAAHFGESELIGADENKNAQAASITTSASIVASAPEAAAAMEPECATAPARDAIADLQPLLSREQRSIERVDALQVGNWVEFQQTGGKVLRCRLAAIIRATGKYIFVNRAGVKVAENNRDGLLKAYLSGELSTLDEGRLFDRALESVIGNLRDMKTRTNTP